MKRYRGFEFRRGVETFSRKAASALSLARIPQVVWTGTITTAGVDRNGRLFLADVDDDAVLTHADLTKYCGFVLHELCHIAYTDFNVTAANDYLKALHNAVEDAFIEHRAIRRNLVGNVTEVFTVLIDGMVARASASVSDWADPRQYPFLLAVYLRNHAATKLPLANGLQPIFDGAADRLQGATNSTDTLAIAEWVYDQLSNLKPKQEQPSKGKKSKDGDQGSDAGQGASDQAGDQEGDQVGDACAPGSSCHPAEVEPELEISLRRGHGGTYSPDCYVQDIEHHLRLRRFDFDGRIPGKLRYNLKRLFDNSDYTDFQHNRKFGSVNASALATHKYNSNVFKLRREVEGIDSAVVICLDISGSMFDDEPGERRAKLAAQCTSALVDTLRHAQVSTAVLTFGSRIAVLKNWNDSIAVTKDRLSRIDNGSSTNDYQCVRYAHELLLARHEQRKVCIVITDGEGWGNTLRDQIDTGKHLGITTIGVGISLDVSHTYEQNIHVEDVEDLGVATFKNIKLAA